MVWVDGKGLRGGGDDEGDGGAFRGDVFWEADPEVVTVVAGGGGVEEGVMVSVNGDEGAFTFGDEAPVIDFGAVEDPGVEVGRGDAEVAVLEPLGERRGVFFAIDFPFGGELDAVGAGGFGFLFLEGEGFVFGEFGEEAGGAGGVVGEEEGDLEVEGSDGGGEDGFVVFAGFVDEDVFDGDLLMEEGAGEADFAFGGVDLDGAEGVLGGRGFLEAALGGGHFFGELFFRVGDGFLGGKQTAAKQERGSDEARSVGVHGGLIA